MNCLNCQQQTNNPKFCSRSCSASFANKANPKRKLTRLCTKCQDLVKSHRHTLCEFHFQDKQDNQYKNKTIGEYRNMTSVKGKPSSWTHSHIRRFARSWLKHLTKLPCAHCGYDKHVELAHIKDVASFPDHSLLSEVNSEDNIIQLCPNCHWEFDNLPRE